MTPAAKRRWFRFGLWAVVVVVAAVAMLVPAAVSVHRWSVDRRAFLKSEACLASGQLDGQAPWPLRLLGEPGFAVIRVGFIGKFDEPLNSQQQRELERVRQLFPEADVDGNVWREPSTGIEWNGEFDEINWTVAGLALVGLAAVAGTIALLIRARIRVK